MTWGAYMQTGFNLDIERLGSRLSREIHCPMHFPAFGKNMFECKCGVLFPLYLLKGGNWELIRKKHSEGKVI